MKTQYTKTLYMNFCSYKVYFTTSCLFVRTCFEFINFQRPYLGTSSAREGQQAFTQQECKQMPHSHYLLFQSAYNLHFSSLLHQFLRVNTILYYVLSLL